MGRPIRWPTRESDGTWLIPGFQSAWDLTQPEDPHGPAKARSFGGLGSDPRDIKINLFANHKNHTRECYCRKETSASLFEWSKMDSLMWANPPLTQLLKVIGKSCLNPCKLVLTHPKWEEKSGYKLVKKVAAQTVEVPSGTEVYYTDKSKLLLSPQRQTEISLIETTQKRVFLHDLDSQVAESLTFLDSSFLN